MTDKAERWLLRGLIGLTVLVAVLVVMRSQIQAKISDASPATSSELSPDFQNWREMRSTNDPHEYPPQTYEAPSRLPFPSNQPAPPPEVQRQLQIQAQANAAFMEQMRREGAHHREMEQRDADFERGQAGY